MGHKLKRFKRRWRFCKESPYVIKPSRVVWTPADGLALKQFLNSETGYKLLTAIDDVVFNAVMKGGSGDLIEGMIDIRSYVVGLGAPDESGNSDPRVGEDTKGWMVEK